MVPHMGVRVRVWGCIIQQLYPIAHLQGSQGHHTLGTCGVHPIRQSHQVSYRDAKPSNQQRHYVHAHLELSVKVQEVMITLQAERIIIKASQHRLTAGT